MPIHDWTRVVPNIYHHFHGMWIAEVCRALNRGVLPADYYALIDQSTRTMGPDVLTLQRPTRTPHSDHTGGTLTATAAAPPRVRFTASAAARPVPRRRKRVVVRHTSDHRMVAMIELVSPANKSSTDGLRAFVGKVVAAVRERIHVLVIDPFPPGKRDPNGIHGAIWHALADEPFALPPDLPLILASYAAGDEIRSFVETVAVGSLLPDMPLFLESDAYVAVPLESTYLAAWADVPSAWRGVVEAEADPGV